MRSGRGPPAVGRPGRSEERPLVSRRRFIGLFALGAAAAACAPHSPAPSQPSKDVTAFQTVSELTVGPNRFAFALVNPDGTEPEARAVLVDFYYLAVGSPQSKARAPATRQSITVETPHRHPDGTLHTHAEVRSIYVVAGVVFDRPGPWGADINIRLADGSARRLSLALPVTARGATPAVGAPVPLSRSPTAGSPDELAAICSHEPPDDMHRVSVADALASRRPLVVVFATPAFCRSRVCGPVLDLVLQIEPQYRDRVEFVHIEPYNLKLAREQGRLELGPTAREWGLPSEPWVFVVDSAGRVAAKFEGILGSDELAAAIPRVAN